MLCAGEEAAQAAGKQTVRFGRRAVYNRSVEGEAKRKAERQKFTLWQRFVLAAGSTLTHAFLSLLLRTLRWSFELSDDVTSTEPVKPAIYVFWHRCLAPGVYGFRDKGLAVMISSSFDGEYIARVAEKFGYQTTRGSSTRGGARALLGMHRLLERGTAVVFTIDGPRGPRYVAKPGPVMLARNTGAPIWAFHIAIEKAWVLRSWDRLMIPKPFSRALLCISTALRVPADANEEQMAQYHAQMQAMLDAVREKSEAGMRAMTGRNA